MLKLAVRSLAEFVHQRGDLRPQLGGRARAEEGIATQRRLQNGRPESYERERAVSLTTRLAGVEVTLGGRIDGCDLQAAPVLVEEFKTTRADPALAYTHHGEVHWAQARLYAALLARELQGMERFLLRLVYCHPDTEETAIHTREESADSACAFLEATLREYAQWLEHQQAHEQMRDRRLRSLPFPFPEYRPFQRAMARRSYRALRDREHLLLEAPTGSGKTMATLYPALRALEGAGYRRILFLTSRTTGALAVREAAARMDPGGGYLRIVQITAKEKACLVPGTPCDPELCSYARGYYDRVRAAVTALLERRSAGPEAVTEVATAHHVCPFELSLDTALWCDLVVADYNYVFDPLVRLQRLGGDPETALLIDESHQLAPRVREMLSLAVSRREVRDALAEHPGEPLGARLRALDRALTGLKRRESLAAERTVGRPEALFRSMRRFLDTVVEVSSGGVDALRLESWPATRELMFNCARWLRSETWYAEERFRFLASASGREVEVRLACLDPAPYIRARLDEFGGHIRFSGTVSPLTLYAHLHGEAEAPVERAGNPFTPEQLEVLVVDDVPTYLRHRHQSADALARLIHDVADAKAGHYLVAFPSFEYLDLVAEASAALDPARERLCQRAGASDEERSAFLAEFRPEASPKLGFVVLGGVFGESVDFSSAHLAGVVCVGVGLPPPSLVRGEIERHFDGHGLDGAAVAYHQPAMVKVLQMAGRLLRSPEDRGVLCLVDARFRKPAYRQFFPEHWRPHTVRAREAAACLERFWQGA